MQNKLISIAPHRISICGGGTDFPSFYNNHNGAVINFAITRFSKIKLRTLKNKYIVIGPGDEFVVIVEEGLVDGEEVIVEVTDDEEIDLNNQLRSVSRASSGRPQRPPSGRN